MNSCQLLLDNKELLYALAAAAYALLEFWLGKTDRIQAGSLLEAIINGLKPKSPEDQGDGKTL